LRGEDDRVHGEEQHGLVGSCLGGRGDGEQVGGESGAWVCVVSDRKGER